MMNLKAMLVGTMLVAANAANADFVPYYQSGTIAASVQFGSYGKVEERQPHYINGQQSSLYTAAREIYSLRQKLAADLHTYLSSEAAAIGGTVFQGQLTGTWIAKIQSISPEKNVVHFSGLSYGANFNVKKQKGGFSVSCDGRVVLNNISISVQYDVNSSTVDREKSTVNLNPSQDISSCDTSVSWIPGLGLLVDYAVAEFGERLLQAKASDLTETTLTKAVGQVNDGVSAMTRFFSPSAPLWSNDPYAPKVRDYLANNARYWLSGRSISLLLEPEPSANVVLGGHSGELLTSGSDKSGFVFKLTFSEGASELLTLALTNNVHFGYNWVCSVSNPRRQCQPNY